MATAQESHVGVGPVRSAVSKKQAINVAQPTKVNAKSNPVKGPTAKPAAAPAGTPADKFKVGEKTSSGVVQDSVYDPVYGWLNVTNTGAVLQSGGALAIGADQYGGSYLGYQLSLKGDNPDQYKLETANPQAFAGGNSIVDNGNGTYSLKSTTGHTYTFGDPSAWKADKTAAAKAKTAAATGASHTTTLIMDSLDDYGFTPTQKASLSKQVSAWLAQGYSSDDITTTLLPTTAAYKQRFPLNATRVKMGLSPLSPSEYNQWVATNKQSDTLIDASLQQWGFNPAQRAALMKEVDQWVLKGYNPTDITNTLLPQTKQYEQRFPANATLIKNGFAPLSPADYMSTQQAMQQAARAAGIPDNAYDSNKLIASNVSPSEFSDRITQAYEVINQNPQVAKEFEKYYGIQANHLTAYILDPKNNTFALANKGAVAQVGAGAQQVGHNISKGQATTIQHGGVSAAQLQQGLTQVDQEKQVTGGLVGQHQTGLNQNAILAAASGVNVGNQKSAFADAIIKNNATTQKQLFSGMGSVGSNNQGEQGAGSVSR